MCSGYYRALFRGSFNGEKVAIKRVRADRTKFHENEKKILNKFNHPNVIKLLQVTQNANYRSVGLIVQIRIKLTNEFGF
jgi:serine/threonine protein kinase